MIAKVCLRPLKRLSYLTKLCRGEFTGCMFEGDLFTLTFCIQYKGVKMLQDLAIGFEDKRFPRVYLSDPYIYQSAAGGQNG